MRTAIVYDWIDSWGGAERILIELNKLFPDAHWYTSTVNLEKATWAAKLNITPSFIQKLPSWIRNHRLRALVLYPFAFESFDFSSYDLVISVTSGFAKGVITRPETKHLCIMLTPMRFLWGEYQEKYISNMMKFFLSPYIAYLKKWDTISAHRPDRYVAISETVQKRIKNVYAKSSDVVYPPFDIEYWKSVKPKHVENLPKEYFLIVSRVERYKKVDLALESVQKIGKHLVIVGKGSQIGTLKSISKPAHSTFLNDISDEKLAYLYSQAQAFIMPQEEDFGYTSLEAQFFGCPVIAFNKGGATETIIEGKTGIFFKKQTVESLTQTLEEYGSIGYNLRGKTKINGPKNAERFSSDMFRRKFLDIINL